MGHVEPETAMTTRAMPGASVKPAKAAPPARTAKTKSFSFFDVDPVALDRLPDSKMAKAQHDRLLRLVKRQSIIIAILVGILILGMPFFRPIYNYYVLTPDNQRMPIVMLTMPNMTNRAVLSWATTSITEIMTIGFGDFETRLMAQKPRFTPEGWESFAKAFVRQKIGESFKQNQLVLTTVPADTPVIVAQGQNAQHIYEWHVQMPVIMTYATNNNITRREKAVIELTIVRVPPEQNPSGIGISVWRLKQ